MKVAGFWSFRNYVAMSLTVGSDGVVVLFVLSFIGLSRRWEKCDLCCNLRLNDLNFSQTANTLSQK